MPEDAFVQLLDATVRHLETLRQHGVRYVSVDPERLADLAPATAINRQRPTLRTTAHPAAAVRPPTTVRPPATVRPAPSPTRPPGPLPRPSPPPSSSALNAPSTSPADASPAPSAARPQPGTLPAPPQPSLSLNRPRHALSPAEKEVAIAALRNRALACRKCAHLAASRRHVVFGVGDIHSPLMFVGEAPGADEDAQGEPFVGKAGQLLTRILQTMGLSREQVYIANILKCRPDTPGQSSGNRKPTPSEMATCLPYLLEQIDLIQPQVIVALGATAVEGLFGRTEGITRARGQWLTFRDTPVMPTYHPAYLLRNQSLSVKRLVWEDMLAVLEKLGRPISDKQRGYFLKP